VYGRVCFDYKKGECFRGMNCRFRHADCEENEGEQPARTRRGIRGGSKDSSVSGNDNYEGGGGPPTRRGRGRRRVKGDAESDYSREGSKDSKDSRDSRGSRGSQYISSREGSRESSRERAKGGGKSNRVCFDFQKGMCFRGSSCRFSHGGGQTTGDVGGYVEESNFQGGDVTRVNVSQQQISPTHIQVTHTHVHTYVPAPAGGSSYNLAGLATGGDSLSSLGGGLGAGGLGTGGLGSSSVGGSVLGSNLGPPLPVPPPGFGGGSGNTIGGDYLSKSNLSRHTDSTSWVCMKCFVSVAGTFCSNCGTSEGHQSGDLDDIVDKLIG